MPHGTKIGRSVGQFSLDFLLLVVIYRFNISSFHFVHNLTFHWSTKQWQTAMTHFCGHIVARDCLHPAQTGKHLLRTQNVSERNEKHFCVLDTNFFHNRCCARGQTGKHLRPKQCVCNMSTLTFTYIHVGICSISAV